MRHHDILPGHDYCPILDKLETKLPPWKRIYVEDADACSHVLDPSFSQNGFWTCRFQSIARQNLAFCIRGRRKKFICGIERRFSAIKTKCKEIEHGNRLNENNSNIYRSPIF